MSFPGESFRLEFNPSESELFWAIPNQSEESFEPHPIQID